MKMLIVEDNYQDAQYMTRKLAEMGYTTIDPVDSVKRAIQLIEEEAPQVVIFDYEIKNGYGTDVVEYFNQRIRSTQHEFPFHYAFITSHEAEIKELMFELNHPNFLGVYLKTDFDQALEDISEKFAHYKDAIRGVSDVVKFIGIHEKQQDRLLMKDNNICYVIELSKILYMEGEGGYTTIFWTENGRVKKVLKSAKSLAAYQNSLADKFFLRISRSHLINLAHLVEFDNRNTSYVKLDYLSKPLAVTRGYEAYLKNAVGLVNV